MDILLETLVLTTSISIREVGGLAKQEDAVVLP
jgi:hypothetical protein